DSTFNPEPGFEDSAENPLPAPLGSGVDSNAYTESTTTSKQSTFSIAPGIEYHLSTNSNIDPYVGLQIPLTFQGTRTVDSTISKEGYDSGDKVKYDFEETREIPGGFGFGVQGIVGFNWFVSDKVAIGMEYTLGVMSTSTGGEVSIDQKRTGSHKNNYGNVTNGQPLDTWAHNTETTNGGFSTQSRGGLNVSIFF
ncbi:MAG: hypothetical protein ABEH38_03995, partial [Flavobacteriales bacterium]